MVCIECPSISLKFRWIVCPRPPPSVLRSHTYRCTHSREQGRTCDHTNPHPRVQLVKRVWVAHTREKRKRGGLSRGEYEEEESHGGRRTNLGEEQEEADEEEEDEEEEEEERGLRRRE